MSGRDVVVRVPGALGFLLPLRDRAELARRLAFDPDATLGHLVQAAGVPLTEVGALLLDGSPTAAGAPGSPRAVVQGAAARRPPPGPAGGFPLPRRPRAPAPAPRAPGPSPPP